MKSIVEYINESVSAKGNWDTTEDMWKKGTIGKKVWDMMYKFQESQDPNILSKLAAFLEKTFGVKCSVPTPNHNEYGVIKALKDGKEIAKLDVRGDEIHLDKIQSFLDAISK